VEFSNDRHLFAYSTKNQKPQIMTHDLTPQVYIPKPCHEDWNRMTPNDRGAHCAVCCKTVVDFSQKSPEEIRDYMVAKQNVQGGEKVCGRFRADQVRAEEPPQRAPMDRSIPRKLRVFAYALVSFFGFLFVRIDSAHAQGQVMGKMKASYNEPEKITEDSDNNVMQMTKGDVEYVAPETNFHPIVGDTITIGTFNKAVKDEIIQKIEMGNVSFPLTALPQNVVVQTEIKGNIVMPKICKLPLVENDLAMTETIPLAEETSLVVGQSLYFSKEQTFDFTNPEISDDPILTDAQNLIKEIEKEYVRGEIAWSENIDKSSIEIAEELGEQTAETAVMLDETYEVMGLMVFVPPVVEKIDTPAIEVVPVINEPYRMGESIMVIGDDGMGRNELDNLSDENDTAEITENILPDVVIETDRPQLITQPNQNKICFTMGLIGYANVNPVVEPDLTQIEPPVSTFDEMVVFPNPTSDFVNLEYSLKEKSVVTIQLFDLSGKLIRTVADKNSLEAGKYSEQIDLKDLVAGTYLITLISSDEMKSSKLVIAR